MAQAQIADVLEWLLDEAAAALDGRDGQPGAPTRRVVEHGVVQTFPDTECAELLAAWWQRVVPKPNTRNPGAQDCTIVTQVQFAVELRRCVPTVTAQGGQSADEETAANLQLARDVQAVWKRITRDVVTGELPDGVSCDRVQMGFAEPTVPAGGMAGGRIVLTITL